MCGGTSDANVQMYPQATTSADNDMHPKTTHFSEESLNSPSLYLNASSYNDAAVYHSSSTSQNLVAPLKTVMPPSHPVSHSLDSGTSFQSIVPQVSTTDNPINVPPIAVEKGMVFKPVLQNSSTQEVKVGCRDIAYASSPQVPSPDTQSCSTPDISGNTSVKESNFTDDSGIDANFQSYTISSAEYEAMENSDGLVSTSIIELLPEKKSLSHTMSANNIGLYSESLVNKPARQFTFDAGGPGISKDSKEKPYLEEMQDPKIEPEFETSTPVLGYTCPLQSLYDVNVYEEFDDCSIAHSFFNHNTHNQAGMPDAYTSGKKEGTDIRYWQHQMTNACDSNPIQLLGMPGAKSDNKMSTFTNVNTTNSASPVLLNPIPLLTEKSDDEGFPLDSECSKDSTEFSSIDLDLLHDTIKSQVI